MLSKVVGLQLTVDKRNNLGYTAMLLACKLGNFDNALALLTVGGACPYIRDMEHRYCARNWINWLVGTTLFIGEFFYTAMAIRY